MGIEEAYRITEENLAHRRGFLRLGERDREVLLPLVGWARRESPAIARRFFDWQFEFEPTRRFLESVAQERGVDLTGFRRALEDEQAKYLIEIFEGAEGGWTLDYFRKRLHVGTLHDSIDLPMKWYLGGYAEYRRLLRQSLPWWLHLRPNKRDAILAALDKVFTLDQQAVADSYLLSLLDSIGL